MLSTRKKDIYVAAHGRRKSFKLKWKIQIWPYYYAFEYKPCFGLQGVETKEH